ncbi:Bidirectional sugar transporter SWEET6b, partial [Linum perenne]
IAGNVISFGLFLSPLPTFVKIWKKGSVEQFKPDPYLASTVNCMSWVVYGLPFVNPDGLLVLTTNAVGTAIAFIYVTIFLIYSDKRKRIKIMVILVVEISFIALLLLLVVLLVPNVARRTMIVGVVAVVFCVINYGAPLSVLKMVIETRSVEYMPFFLSLACFANGACWTAYALIRIDWFLVIPNGSGALLGLVQLILYATFYKSTKKQIAERVAASANQKGPDLSEVVVVVEGDSAKKHTQLTTNTTTTSTTVDSETMMMELTNVVENTLPFHV